MALGGGALKGASVSHGFLMSLPDSRHLTGEGTPGCEGHLLKFTHWQTGDGTPGLGSAPHLDGTEVGSLCGSPAQLLGFESP